MNSAVKEHARFDARLPKEQKEYFEKAASLGGYRNLTDFVIMAVQEKAKEIINEREVIITSEKDSKVFFEAITNPQKPNRALTKAFKEYNAFTTDRKAK